MLAKKITSNAKVAISLHKNVPKDWYDASIKKNIFQRFWHYTRFRKIGSLIHNLKGTFLDIGCCDGTFTKIILDESKATKIYAIDVLESCVDYAKEKYKGNKKLVFSFGEATTLPFPSKKFDAVFCLEALEHFQYPLQAIVEMKRVLKPNGKVFILIPHENTLFKIIWSFWTKSRGKIWKGTHLQHYSNSEFVTMIQKGGFTIINNHTFLLDMLQIIVATY